MLPMPIAIPGQGSGQAKNPHAPMLAKRARCTIERMIVMTSVEEDEVAFWVTNTFYPALSPRDDSPVSRPDSAQFSQAQLSQAQLSQAQLSQGKPCCVP